MTINKVTRCNTSTYVFTTTRTSYWTQTTILFTSDNFHFVTHCLL